MDYDVAVIGGGLAGSSLGLVLARAGRKILVLEREAAFRDRVRGEGMLPWGAAEARTLGLYEPLLDHCGHEARFLTSHGGNRDLVDTSPSRLGVVNFHHPEMQQCLLELAAAQGVTVERPAEAVRVEPGDPPTNRLPAAVFKADGREQRVTARLVVGADGRNSLVRTLAGFATSRDPDGMVVAGILYRGMKLPDNAVQMVINPETHALSIVFPVGQQRFRAYVAFRQDARQPLSGARDEAAFIDESIALGAPAEWFRDAETIGPLASFHAPDVWAPHPHRDGIVLIGDAAAASDPVFGCGLSLALRDVRVLRDHLLKSPDWTAAAEAYAADHDRYYDSLHRTHALWRKLYFEPGAEADALRARALPLIAEDPTRMVDFIGLGPEAPNDVHARGRFYGEA